jgi:hypothetical protein
VALPAIVGFVAGRFGVLAGVGLLGLASVLILLLIPRNRKDEGESIFSGVIIAASSPLIYRQRKIFQVKFSRFL